MDESNEKALFFNDIYQCIKSHNEEEVENIVPDHILQTDFLPDPLLFKVLAENNIEKESISIEELAVIYKNIEALEYFNSLNQLNIENLQLALLLNQTEIIKKLIDLGIDPTNIILENENISTENLKILIESPKFNINSVNQQGRTALINAIFSFNNENLKILIEKGADVNLRELNYSPIHYAILKENLNAVKILLNNTDCDPNLPSKSHSWAPIHYASYLQNSNNSTLILKQLLEHKNINPNPKTQEHCSALDIALKKGNMESCCLLLKSEKFIVDNPKMVLQALIRNDHYNSIVALRNRHVDVSTIVSDISSLIYSCFLGKIESTRALLGFDEIDVNVKYKIPIQCGSNRPNPQTTMHCQHKECPHQYSTNQTPQPKPQQQQNITNHNSSQQFKPLIPRQCTNETPLHIACKNSNYPFTILRLLLLHPRIEVNSIDILGKTPLHYAARSDNVNAVELLLDHPKIKPDEVSNDKMTPFMECCYKSSVDVANLLLSHSIDINRIGPREMTPLMLACYGGNFKMVKFLIENCHSIKPFINTHAGTAFGIAVSHKFYDIVEYLFKRKLFNPYLIEADNQSLYDVVLSMDDIPLRSEIINEIETILTNEPENPNPYLGRLYA